MHTWMVDAASRHHTLPVDAVATLLHAADDRAPAARLLEFLNQIVAVDFLSLVSHVSPQDDPAPRLVEGHSQAAGGRNVTAECFAIYRQRYWQNDPAAGIADHLRGERAGASAVTVLHCLPDDIPVASWRNEIYERERLAGRFTFLYTPQPGQAYSINLYRRQPLGAFRGEEVDRLLATAPLLRQVHRQVLARAASPAAHPAVIDGPVPDAERLLAATQCRLSPRELQVCARIACGITADGIAADLGIAPSTVVTLRKRAYVKLAGAGMVGGRWRLMLLARLGLRG